MSRTGMLMLGLYILHVLGMLWTENAERGLFDLEVKFSLLAVPLAFVGFRFLNTTNFTNVLRMIYVGAIAAAVLCEVMAVYNYYYGTPLEGYQPYHFFYMSMFTVTMHHSYYSLYANFAILIYAYLNWPLFMQRGIRGVLTDLLVVVFLSVTIVQSGSKIGMLIWIGLMISISIFLSRDMVKRKWLPLLFVLLALYGVVIAVKNNPTLEGAVANALKVAQEDDSKIYKRESTYVRKLIYTSVWDLISEQQWYGQGTGDFQDALDAEYTEQALDYHKERHFNAHNLFLQTWITLGIPGLIMILALFANMIWQAMLNRGRLYIGFIGMFLFISMTESTFNTQPGVVFFSFFAVLFARRPSHDYLTIDDMAVND